MANKYPWEEKGNTPHPTIHTTTPPKFNIAPEKLPSQKVSTISNHPFSGAMLNFRWVYITLEKHHHRSPKSLDGLEMMFHDSFLFPKGHVLGCHLFPTQVMYTKSPFLVSYVADGFWSQATYCWWKKSYACGLVVYPTIYSVSTSQVVQNFFYQQCFILWAFSGVSLIYLFYLCRCFEEKKT